MDSTSTTSPMETKQDNSTKRSREHATSPDSKVEEVESTTTTNVEEVNEENICSSDGFTTPKGKRFQIPEIVDCPPAPKRKRTWNCPPFRTSKSFSSPEMELFLTTIRKFAS